MNQDRAVEDGEYGFLCYSFYSRLELELVTNTRLVRGEEIEWITLKFWNMIPITRIGVCVCVCVQREQWQMSSLSFIFVLKILMGQSSDNVLKYIFL